ncbi:MAG TPA: prepilin-type N-terminal cleavage/methylation domain-containing protein [Candidatus Saccharimonadales bacterium]
MSRLVKIRSEKGFTVTELMIATAVFGVLLLVIATAILQLTRVYYKGVTEAKLQSTARSLVDGIAQSIQFSGQDVTSTAVSPTPGTNYAFCVGNSLYSYTTGYSVSQTAGANEAFHGIVVSDEPGCESTTAPQDVKGTPSLNGRELLEPNMRVARLDITSVGGDYYRISVRLIYGDDEVVFNPASPGDATGFRSPNAACRSIRVGAQFCAVADITANVTKRVK